MTPLKIDICVGGRFHSDRMAKALINGGHDVRLLTCLPKSRCPLVPAANIRSFLMPEILYRVGRRLGMLALAEDYKMQSFADAAAGYLKGNPEDRDVFIGWSSFSKEAIEASRARKKIIIRDSTHIEYQYEVVRREYHRLGLPFIERPACVARELAEYAMADQIIVLSRFAKKTMVDRGISEEKVSIVRLGVDRTVFKPRELFEPKRPLKAVFFGAVSVRKGVAHMLEATKHFSPRELQLFVIGPVEKGLEAVLRRYTHATFLPAMPQVELAEAVREMDLFLFPSLEDGFAFTVAQAMASGLVPVMTEVCGTADLLEDGKSCFLVKPADPEGMAERIQYFVEDPRRLIPMRKAVLEAAGNLGWGSYGKAVNALVTESFEPEILKKAA